MLNIFIPFLLNMKMKNQQSICNFNHFMKYSLKNKEFKKRNTIFGEHIRKEFKHQEDQEEADLGLIQEEGEDLEDSKIKIRQQKTDSIYQFINYDNTAQMVRISPINKNQKREKFSNKERKHALSPNNKPNFNLSQKVWSKSMLQPKLKKPENKSISLSIESKTISFSYYQSKSDNNQNKQLIKILYCILIHNNERLSSLADCMQIIMKNVQFGLSGFTFGFKQMKKMESKVEIFLNTMRSVYEDLRIVKLKQENLQLYFKQSNKYLDNSQTQISKIHHKEARENVNHKNYIKTFEVSKENKQFQESQQLMTLLEYQSDESFQSYKNINNQKDNQFAHHNKLNYPNPFVKNKNNHNFNHQNQRKNQQSNYSSFLSSGQEKPYQTQTFRFEESKYNKLSPFQANPMTSSVSQSQFSQSISSKKQSQVIPFKSYNSRQSHAQSPHNYSFDKSESQYQKMKEWIQKSGQRQLRCWLDQMNCLRRANMTYMFNSRGEVITISRNTFDRLSDQGYILPSSIL